jgi:hypothetical protein
MHLYSFWIRCPILCIRGGVSVDSIGELDGLLVERCGLSGHVFSEERTSPLFAFLELTVRAMPLSRP